MSPTPGPEPPQGPVTVSYPQVVLMFWLTRLCLILLMFHRKSLSVDSGPAQGCGGPVGLAVSGTLTQVPQRIDGLQLGRPGSVLQHRRCFLLGAQHLVRRLVPPVLPGPGGSADLVDQFPGAEQEQNRSRTGESPDTELLRLPSCFYPGGGREPNPPS